MGRHRAADYDDDDDAYDREDPDPSDQDDDDSADVDTIACPHCGRDVYAAAEQCPRCGRYLSSEDTPRRTQPAWVVVTAVVILAVMVFALIRFGI